MVPDIVWAVTLTVLFLAMSVVFVASYRRNRLLFGKSVFWAWWIGVLSGGAFPIWLIVWAANRRDIRRRWERLRAVAPVGPSLRERAAGLVGLPRNEWLSVYGLGIVGMALSSFAPLNGPVAACSLLCVAGVLIVQHSYKHDARGHHLTRSGDLVGPTAATISTNQALTDVRRVEYVQRRSFVERSGDVGIFGICTTISLVAIELFAMGHGREALVSVVIGSGPLIGVVISSRHTAKKVAAPKDPRPRSSALMLLASIALTAPVLLLVPLIAVSAIPSPTAIAILAVIGGVATTSAARRLTPEMFISESGRFSEHRDQTADRAE